jgi:hypothetical protein
VRSPASVNTTDGYVDFEPLEDGSGGNGRRFESSAIGDRERGDTESCASCDASRGAGIQAVATAAMRTSAGVVRSALTDLCLMGTLEMASDNFPYFSKSAPAILRCRHCRTRMKRKDSTARAMTTTPTAPPMAALEGSEEVCARG